MSLAPHRIVERRFLKLLLIGEQCETWGMFAFYPIRRRVYAGAMVVSCL